MAANPLMDQLFDTLEDLLIENRALTKALDTAVYYIPPNAQSEVRKIVENALSDPELRGWVSRTVAQYKHQSLESTLAAIRRGDWKKN